MRWATRAITTLAACALACGSGGGGNNPVIVFPAGFPQGFLPQLLTGSGGRGDVAFRPDGDLFAVGGGTSRVTRISRTDGAVTTFALDASGGVPLRSIVATSDPDTWLFAGDSTGTIWRIQANGSSELVIDTGSDPITGLAIAPAGFGDFAGSLFAAAGDGGILRITTGATPASVVFADPGVRYVDVGFSGTTLYALDATDDQVDTIPPAGTPPTTLQGGFSVPVGMAIDTFNGEVYVADAGPDVLRTFPIAGGTVTDRASYDFDSDGPSGVAWDGAGTIAWVTSAPFAVRGSALPRIDPANANLGLRFEGPKVGFGDLELDRAGAFVFVANDTDTDGIGPDTASNFLISVRRDGSVVTRLDSDVGTPIEQLTGVAVDPLSQTIYFASRSGNVYRRLADGTRSLLAQVPGTGVLGLELAPPLPPGQGFDPFNDQLIATTQDGNVWAIDRTLSQPTPVRITSSPIGTHLVDLVFSTPGVLYVVDNDESNSRILRVTSSGGSTVLTASTQLGLADGIEIDEGANRLLVTTDKSTDQLLAVSLGGTATITGLANTDIDEGFLPTGVVYDRLGTAVVRVGDTSTAIDAIDVSP